MDDGLSGGNDKVSATGRIFGPLYLKVPSQHQLGTDTMSTLLMECS